MGALDYLADFSVRHPVAHTWNAMLGELAKRLPKWITVGRTTGTFIHPFYTTAVPWDDMPKGAPYDQKRAWRVDVVSGCVNDAVASIPYMAQDDPRGWVMAVDYPFAPVPVGAVIDRPLYDKIDNPFLVVQAPSEDGADLVNFVLVPDGNRPPFFKTEEMWARSLFQTSLFVSADPKLVITFNPSLPRALSRRYRLFTGKPQTALVTNVKEIARLYLTRDATNKPDLDELIVQQRVFWDLQAMIVQAGMNLFATAEVVRNIGVDPVTDAYGSIVADSLIEMALPLSYTAWWTA